MHVVRIALRNWISYRGEQTIDLQPKVYSVSASHVDNPLRSNWIGKSSFLEAIEFALYGQHRFQREDDFITRGEKDCFVELETDDGFTIRRERNRGKTTQLLVTDGTSRLKKDEAEARIIQRIGLDKHDFRNTAYFQQRMMSRFVLAKPEERMGIIASWFRLEPLQDAEKNVKAKVRSTLERLKDIQSQLDQRQSFIEQNVRANNLDPENLEESYSHQLTGLTKEAEDARLKITTLDSAISAVQVERSEWQRKIKAKGDLAVLAKKGKEVRAELENIQGLMNQFPCPTQEEIGFLREKVDLARTEQTKLAAAFSAASKELNAKKALSQGCFDGMCPVNKEHCPVTDKINAPRKRNLELYDAAKASHLAVQEAYAASSQDVQAAETALHRAQNAAADYRNREQGVEFRARELSSLRTQYEALAPVAKTAQDASSMPDDTELRAERDSLRKRELEANTSIQYLKRAYQGILEAHETIRALTLSRDQIMTEVVTYQEAAQILGRNGAQKRVAEGALADIESGANELLRTCGIDLNIGVQWAREGGGLAVDCDACGAPFPASQKVKKCACGAERGPKVVNKLDIVLSDRSGAAEDLGGIAFQLSASAWLRNDRAASWGVAMLDEPTGALDEANRATLSTHLANMLRGQYGFEQGFIVSHHKSTTDAMPGRIEIIADGNGSRLKVA